VLRSRAHTDSPTATSATSSGVARIASKVLAYLYLTKKLKVVSNTTPFMADTASMPGATKTS
jgi:hypothetical protein